MKKVFYIFAATLFVFSLVLISCEKDQIYVKGQYRYENGELIDIDSTHIPTVHTKVVENVTGSSAVCGGEVTNSGTKPVTARGVCWSTSQMPTINDNYTTDGEGMGSYPSYITRLTPGTTYYVRAYATNAVGTAYGEQKQFNTGEVPLQILQEIVNSMIYVEGGTFQMGATSEQGSDAESYEYPVHQVTVSSFYMGETEVTQQQWEAIMGYNPGVNIGDVRPVELVSYYDCLEFIQKLNLITGRTFRLPTEAEWEYAARGGNRSRGYKYAGSNIIGDVAWYTVNGSWGIHPVKTKQPNELGLYDMSGNVWEWCYDWFDYYSSSSQTNPTGPSSGYSRIIRGGSWINESGYCRVSYRGVSGPTNRRDYIGFRLVLVP